MMINMKFDKNNVAGRFLNASTQWTKSCYYKRRPTHPPSMIG